MSELLRGALCALGGEAPVDLHAPPEDLAECTVGLQSRVARLRQRKERQRRLSALGREPPIDLDASVEP